MQSSSGGDEEYDSQPESVPALLNTSGHFSTPLSNPHPSLVSHHHDHPSTFFDPSANYLNHFSHSQPNNSLLNLEGVRPRRLRSEPNCADLGNLPGSSSSSQYSILGAQGLNQGSFPSSSSMQSRPSHENGVRSLTQSDQTSVVKNPRKRTRASRRAPTTVLTTDTTNFRAMVQEFTGVPAPPFSVSSYSRRLDLFGSGSGMRSSHLEPVGSLYPLRPSAKRVQPTPFASKSSPSLLNNPLVVAANITSTTSNSTIPTSITATTNAFNPTSSNYQLPCDLGLLKQPQNMLNLQNQGHVLSFQSFLQPTPLHPSLNLPGFSVKSQGSSIMPSFDELGLSHGHVNANLSGLQSHEPDGARLRSDSNWRDGIGLNGGNQDHLRPIDGNYGNNTDHNYSQRVNGCKLNCSASSSDFPHDKGLENVSSRAEGTVDSWICPAD
ncbi:uncharacterized protein LOC111314950 isoform X2 [Durio zibethinus]|nr:uncharacterized protein LOC111314950 isoform X2 [Durio zibethinus]